MTKNVLLVSGGMAVLLLAGVGCEKTAIVADVDVVEAPAETGFEADVERVDAPTEEPEPGTCKDADGNAASCVSLMLYLSNDLTAAQRNALERQMTADGAKVERHDSVAWPITPAAAGSEEYDAWLAQLSTGMRGGFVYMDGSKLRLVKETPELTLDDRQEMVQRAGYMGGASEYRGALSIVPWYELTLKEEDALEQAFAAMDMRVARHDDERWTVTIPTRTSEGLHLWYGKLKALSGVAHVYYNTYAYPSGSMVPVGAN